MTRLAFPANYPARPPFFFARFLRVLDRCRAVHDLGTDGAWLLTVIVLLEDDLRYSKPAAFWNGPLQERTGWGRSKLFEIRDRCVAHGWLHYEPGTRRRPAAYWVTIPDWADRLDVVPTEQEHANRPPNRTEHRTEHRTELRPPSTLDPIPDPHHLSEGGGGCSLSRRTDPDPDPETIPCERRPLPQSPGPLREIALPPDSMRDHAGRVGATSDDGGTRRPPSADDRRPTDRVSRPRGGDRGTTTRSQQGLSTECGAPAPAQRTGRGTADLRHPPATVVASAGGGPRPAERPDAAAADDGSRGGDPRNGESGSLVRDDQRPASDGPGLCDRLLAAGVHRAVETLDAARAGGLSDAAIAAVLDHFASRPGAWGPGALVLRLTSPSARLLDGPAAGWPPPSPQEARHRDASRLRDAQAARRTQAASAARDRERDDARWTQLELEFGPQLDALDRDEHFRLLEAVPFLRKAYLQLGPQAPVVRGELLRALAARYTAPSN